MCINLISWCVCCINNQNHAGWSNCIRKRILSFFFSKHFSHFPSSKSPFSNKYIFFAWCFTDLSAFPFFLETCILNYSTIHKVLNHTLLSLVLFVSAHHLHYLLYDCCVQDVESDASSTPPIPQGNSQIVTEVGMDHSISCIFLFGDFFFPFGYFYFPFLDSEQYLCFSWLTPKLICLPMALPPWQWTEGFHWAWFFTLIQGVTIHPLCPLEVTLLALFPNNCPLYPP